LGGYTAEVFVLCEEYPSADIRTLFEVALIRVYRAAGYAAGVDY
jgi:hypothetical protein